MSLSLNRAVKETRQYLVEQTWPRSVYVRNPGFIGAALRIEWSDKQHLSVAIYDQLGRAHLKEHAEGGVKRARGRNIAIPNRRNVRLTAHGVAASDKPRAPGHLRIEDQIYQVRGRGKARQLVPVFILRPKVTIKKDVPFHEDFEEQMRSNIERELPGAVIQAMRTRR
jgi:hypothetical protein